MKLSFPRFQESALVLFTVSLSIAVVSCASEEVCDWEDNDRDGVIDEGFDIDSDGVWACGITQVLYESGEFDCDDNDPEISPFAVEICNGEDTNCDGVVDDGCAQFALELAGPIEYLFVTDIDLDGQSDLAVFGGSINGSDWTISVLELTSPYLEMFSSDILWSPAVARNDRSDAAEGDFFLGYGYGLVPFSILSDGSVFLDLDNIFEIWPEEIILPVKMVSYNVDGSLLSAAYSVDEGIELLQTIVPDEEGFSQVDVFPLGVELGDVLGIFPVDLDLDGFDEVVVVYSHDVFVVAISEDSHISIRNSWHFEESIGQVTSADGYFGVFPDLYLTIPSTWQLLEIQNHGGTLNEVPLERALLRNPLGVAGIDVDSDGDVDLVVSDGNTGSILLFESEDGVLVGTSCVYSTGGQPSQLQTLSLSGTAPILAVTDNENFSLLLVDSLCSTDQLRQKDSVHQGLEAPIWE